MIHRHFVFFTATTQAFVALVMATVPLVVVAALSKAPDHQPSAPAPSPELDPSEVVGIQVEALRNNSLLMAISGDDAHQLVTVTDREGEETRYHWVLSRQGEGEFKDCWMTNAVIAAEPTAQREFVNMQAG